VSTSQATPEDLARALDVARRTVMATHPEADLDGAAAALLDLLP